MGTSAQRGDVARDGADDSRQPQTWSSVRREVLDKSPGPPGDSWRVMRRLETCSPTLFRGRAGGLEPAQHGEAEVGCSGLT